MFDIFFCLLWLMITAFCTWVFYGMGGDITVNGTPVSQEEFSGMLMPKIVIGIFWLIGLFLLFKGIKKCIKNASTNVNGELCYGKICSVYESGAYVNERPELKADFLVYIPSTLETKTISEIIGFDYYKYTEGTYVELKYYNGDINIEAVIDSSILPLDAKNALVDSSISSKNPARTIIVDGVEYVRKDSIDELL